MSIQGRPSPSAGSRRPPFSKRLRPGHWMALDFLVAAVCAVVMFLAIAAILTRSAYGRWPGVLVAAVLALALAAPLALRRRGPLAALTASMAAAVIAPLATIGMSAQPPGMPTPQLVLRAPAFLLPTAYVLYLVAALYRRRTAVWALAAVLTLFGIEVTAGIMHSRGGGGPGVVTGFIVIFFWMVGYGVAQRRAYADQLRDQAASGAVTEERLRIARELHDVVAHGMAVIAVQAGYGRHVIDQQPEKAREALGAIQATSREALAEMRRMLGVLRQPDLPPFGRSNVAQENRAAAGRAEGGDRAGGGQAANGAAPRRPARAGSDGVAVMPGDGLGAGGTAPLAPAPGLAELDRLVARIASGGVRAEVQVLGRPRELPPGIDLAAFRIVQEALTNVVKHAGVAACRVTVSYAEDGLSVEIADEGRGSQIPATAGAPGPGAAAEGGGHGLIGMRERVSLYGGELRAGPRPEGGYLVAARLPVTDEKP